MPPNLSLHPSQRTHRFFDSKGPGGVSTPRPIWDSELEELGGELVEIRKSDLIPYAHFGYVYCMLVASRLHVTPASQGHLISGGGDGVIKLWQLKKDGDDAIREVEALGNGDGSILSLALNLTLLYAGRLGGEVNVWDLETRQLIRVVKAHQTDILTVSVGGSVMVTGSSDGQCKAFERDQCKSRWEAHRGLVLSSSAAKHNGQPYLVTGGNDGNVAVWNMSSFFSSAPEEIRASNEQLMQSLSRFVSFPTVSSQRDHTEDCHQGASWLRSLFKQFGAITEMLTSDQQQLNPVVFARFTGRGSGRGRLLFYGHYDVVAAGEAPSKWAGDPFQMQGRNGYVYGRGVSDNKGPILAAIYAVGDLLNKQQLDNDVVFLIEGEEECGSRGFEEIVRRHKNTIGEIDWILVANSYWLSDDIPCLTYGLRGALHLKIKVQSGRDDLHSGVHGSSSMSEPLQDLVALLACIRAPNGSVNVPGFYDDIPPLSDSEEQWYNRISDVLQQSEREHENADSLKARWRQPSFTIHGFQTSSSGGNATVIPHAACVDVSFRLVPNQDSKRVLEAVLAFLHEHFLRLNTSNKISISPAHPVDPWLGDPKNQIYRTLEEAIVETWNLTCDEADASHCARKPDTDTVGVAVNSQSKKGKPLNLSIREKSVTRNALAKAPKPRRPLYIREGGTIPAIRFLEKEFAAPAAQLPCGQASDNAHLANERIRLLNLYNSRKIFRKVFQALPRTDEDG